MTNPSPPPGGEGGTSLEPLQGEQPTPLARYSQRIFWSPNPPTQFCRGRLSSMHWALFP
jgi:hypothetical protein